MQAFCLLCCLSLSLPLSFVLNNRVNGDSPAVSSVFAHEYAMFGDGQGVTPTACSSFAAVRVSPWPQPYRLGVLDG